MKIFFAIVLMFSLVSGLTVYAQDASKKSVKSGKTTKVKEQSKKRDVIDAVGQQYLDMLKDYNNQLQEAKKDIEKNGKFAEINHEYVMKLYDNARKYGSRVDQKEIDRARAESNQYYKDIDRLKIRITELQQEKQKLKIDALKYYKGKLPQSFKNKWDEIETEQSLTSKGASSI